MATRKYDNTNLNATSFNMSFASDVAKALDYGNIDLFADKTENIDTVTEVNIKSEEVHTLPEVIEKEVELPTPTPAPKAETSKTKESIPKEKSTKGKTVKSKEKAVTKEPDYIGGKRGRKTVYTEVRYPIFGKCGKDTYDKMTELRYKEKKLANEYMHELVRKEKEAYDKNPDSYAANRRKKAEAVNKMDKGGDGSINFKVEQELADFISDMVFVLRCSKELFLRTIIEIDYEKKFK